jgi:FkbM family methyltransferase
MREYKTRKIIDKSFIGESTQFVATNERIEERVENISHESHVIEEIVHRSRHDDVFWDVGACLGIHSFVVSNFLPYGEIISFEPMPSNRGILADNKSVNQCDNVTVSRKALGTEKGKREFSIRESVKAGYGRHSFSKGDYENIKTIDVHTIDGDSTDYPNPNIVKIDVEGAGPLVIEGMKSILSSDECHTIIFETHEPNPVQPSHEDFGYSREEYIELVEDCGFEVKNLVEDFHFVGYKSTEHTKSLDSSIVETIQTDISDMETEALVNSAGTTLRMGSGVAGSLRQKGGDELNEEAILKGPVEIGEAVRTDAYGLESDYIYHAASMPHYGDGKSTPESIRNSVKKSLKMAESDNVSSISIPLVGCGLGGVPTTTGARVIRDVIDSFNFNNIERINVVAYKDEEYQILNRVFK